MQWRNSQNLYRVETEVEVLVLSWKDTVLVSDTLLLSYQLDVLCQVRVDHIMIL
jgi:hypothetical protein